MFCVKRKRGVILLGRFWQMQSQFERGHSSGMFGLGVAMIGYCLTHMKWWERIGFAIAGLMLIDPGTLTDIIGVAMLGIGLFYQWQKSKSAPKTGEVC